MATEAPRSIGRDPRVKLRPVCPEDRSWLLHLYATTRSAELALMPWDEATKQAFLTLQYEAQRLDYRARFPEASFDVVEWDGEPVGRLYVDRSGGETHLIDITLLPDHQGRGLGSTLLKSLLQESAATGHPVTLHVQARNPARRLYERLGFETVVDEGVYRLMLWVPPIGSSPAERSE
jgi:GNAT superfamily N-acetyltransferase